MARYEHIDSTMEAVDQTYDRLRDRFASRVTYDLDYRIYNLKQLAFLVNDNREAIAEALRRDLDKGPTAVDVEELYPVMNEIDIAVRRLPGWMKDESRIWDAILSFKAMRPKIKKQPKGVALIIGPWNYPWQCNLSPLVGAIAAGCPAIVKPSELAPSSSALLAELLPRYLDPEAYGVILGGQKHAEKLLEKQWGHILFTGSGRVGKLVAGAAAKTLTPTTLELGGKSPVIIAPDADLRKSVRRMLSVKQMGASQMCVCPDYILCVEERLEELLSTIKETLDEWHPPHPHPNSLLNVSSSAKICTEAGFKRQQAFLEAAERQGTVYLRGEVDEERQRMGITVLKMNKGGKGDSSGVLEEEIFGPILPVIPVKDVDEAIAYINARPHPLALYLCCKSSKIQKHVETNTISGSMTTNDFALATINRTIPFGGVGDSGWGAYHGEDGFNTFTHRKAILDVPLFFEPIMYARYPPLTDLKRYIMKQMFVVPLAFSRPTSVEGEKAARRRARLVKVLGMVVAVLVAGYFGRSAGYKLGGWY